MANNKVFYNPNHRENHSEKPQWDRFGSNGSQGRNNRNGFKRYSQGRENSEYEQKGNLGLLFTRRYFEGLTIQEIKSIDKEADPRGWKEQQGLQSSYYKKRNTNIIRQSKRFVCAKGIPESTPIELTTTYPGLLTGTGIPHIANHNGEVKLGLQFDHTTGLPYLPGSSVKGLLRSMFPMRGKSLNLERAIYIWDKLCEIKSGKESKGIVIDLPHCENDEAKSSIICFLELDIFGSDNKDKKSHIQGNDIFFDAFPVRIGEKGLLGLDYITPHSNQFKDPKPIQFIRIEPGVTFRFEFLLHDFLEKTPEGESTIKVSKEAKRELFKAILKDVGIGAKTNVGYGQLTEK